MAAVLSGLALAGCGGATVQPAADPTTTAAATTAAAATTSAGPPARSATWSRLHDAGLGLEVFDVSTADDDGEAALIDRVWPALRFTYNTGRCTAVVAIGADGEPVVASTTEFTCPGTVESLTADPGQLDIGADPVYLHDPAGAPADAFGVKLYGSAEAFAAEEAAIGASPEFRPGTTPGRYAVAEPVPDRGECVVQLYPSAAAAMLWCGEADATVQAIDRALAQT